jgi:DNA-binding response OmpR family regulator
MLPTTKILILEDEEILAENLKSFLNRRSPNVKIASDAISAIEVMQDFVPDLVLLDYGLPGMDGLQTYARILHRKAPQASCVMITGQLTEGVARTSNEYGIRHVLRKPFSFAELENMIEQSLDDGPVPEPSTNGLLKRILSTRRLGLHASPSLAVEQSEQIAINRRNAERRLSRHRRHDDVPDGPERRMTT